jgi:hypothetical protein
MQNILTKADKETLLSCPPKKWFEATDLNFTINRREYRCQRLVDFGMLVTRIPFSISPPVRQYMLTKEGEESRRWLNAIQQ